ncbi:MAG TPA: beta-galactosidase trimerization domain-containing protein [bacterium]|nr:beta-galactosidase trimerization domain-containing protein [bacterium]
MIFHMFRVDYPDNWDKLKELNLEKLAKIKKELYKVDIEWVVGSFGTFPGQGYMVSFNTPYFEKYPGLGDFDYIREYLPYAKKYGIKLVSYLNLHWFSYEFASKHYDWQQITYDGKIYGEKYPLYGNGTTFCINSPFREWALKMMEEVMKTGIDGVFLDGPGIFPESCYCEYCRKKFKEETGHDLPEWENWSDPIWKEFLLFRKKSFLKFMEDAKKVVKRINKDGIIFINSSHLPEWGIPRYIGELEQYQDFNLSEAFYHLGSVRDYFFYYFVAKYLKVSEKPSSAAMHHAAGIWHWIPLYPQEVKMSISQNLCVKNCLWTAVLNGNDIENPEYWQPIKEVMEKVEDKKEIFDKGKTYAPVGLYVSSSTVYFYISEIKGIYTEEEKVKEENLVLKREKEVKKDKKHKCDDITYKELSGFFEVLVRSHIPFKIINENILEENLKKLDVLILPNTTCLSEKEISLINDFVKKGGKLIMSFESGWYDEYGNKREKNPFIDFEIEDNFPLRNAEQYCIFEVETGKYKKGRLVPRPSYSLKIKTKEKVILSFIKPSKGTYSYCIEKSDYPAIIKKIEGKGKIIYFSNLPGEFYNSFHPLEWENIISEIIKEKIEFEIKVDAPSTTITEFYKDSDNWIIHIVNSTGDMKRPVSEIIPVDVKIEIKGKFELSERVFEDGNLKIEKEKDKTNITLEGISLYEIIYLRRAE